MSRTLSDSERLRLEELFDEAAELTPSEREAFVARECGSAGTLHDELRHLLEGLAGEDVLGRLQAGGPTPAGSRIGPYRLLERVGEGGMGEVYAAEQLEPVARKVALKIVKPGMDSAQILARFGAERQALALMTHPNIAQVYDGGVASNGRPYFAMEFVEGEPIIAWCDRRGLSTRARLALFLGVCEAVQHAHHKGVIHRDLKPSNLLVTERDGRAVPKVIDFGVARATSGRLGEPSQHTLPGQVVGTLDYMSPEQADPAGQDIDTRSDIYSLGVVLYQLLSGHLPFERPGESGRPPSEVRRAILEQDPPTPSTRLRREAGTAADVASRRGTDERSLIRQLSGDLDWICLKALEKDPARRYGSASELAADVRRHLAHEPVLAGRPGTLYRARKFVRRHRAGVAAAVVVAAGVAATALSAIEARASARVADALRPRADAYRARQLVQRADELWPPHPEIRFELERWEREARALVDRGLADYRLQLGALRERAMPWSLAERARDRETHPRAMELQAKLGELRDWVQKVEADELSGTELESADARIAELEPEVAALEERVAARRTWSFEDAGDASAHELLSGLVGGLEVLHADLLLAEAPTPEHGWSVPRRLALLRRLEADWAYPNEWGEAIRRIRESARYGGLEILPQTGLVPLGPDPVSGFEEFAHLQTGEPAERGADRELVLRAGTGVVLVLLPGVEGSTMGSQKDLETGPNFDPMTRPGTREGPPVDVDVQAFLLSKYEMTQAQWERTTGTNPSLYQIDIVKQQPLNPVNQVSWHECASATRRLGLRLPTEEEWEYAARGGTSTPSWTDAADIPLSEAENLGFVPNSPVPITRVGSLAANPFGFHDVLGNVSEWCANHPYVYGTEPGSSPETLRLRQCRGGNARFGPQFARSALRNPRNPGADAPFLGLRPARSLELADR